MKHLVIFLDIDGVLNNFASLRKGEEAAGLDPNCIEQLNRLVRETDANIVISSSWRIGYSLPHLRHMLSVAGFEFPNHIIGTTVSSTKNVRGAEIAAWLDRVPVDSFVILDDDRDMEPNMHRFVQTSMETGLEEMHVDVAIRILKEACHGKEKED